MRTLLAILVAPLVLLSLLATAPSASAHADRERIDRLAGTGSRTDSVVQTGRIRQVASRPGQVGISGCFLQTAPLLVTSGTDSVRVWDVSDPADPTVVGILPDVVFENEAMNCGERRTRHGIQRFALIGVDLVQASPDDIEHVNLGGGELIVVDVTTPTRPRILSRTPGSTSTHTVACIDVRNCTYAYTAGDTGDAGDGSGTFTVFDLRDLAHPREVDGDRRTAGVQGFASPTPGHKWNVDAAGIATHTGFGGASMWDVSRPARPRLITTTGAAGRGEDPRFPGWNDFILHNSFRPNARAFEPGTSPSLAHGNVLLITEEDYEQTDCSRAGSFQTWWVKRLDGTPDAIVPLDKVELADLGTFPLPRGGFCSSHWFDYRPGGLVAAGFYGGGTQILDVRDPRDIKPYASSVWGASEVWDAMWVPVYEKGRMTTRRTNVVYAIDLLRGLDVYAVDVPGDGRGAVPPSYGAGPSALDRARAGIVPIGLVALASGAALALRRRRRPRELAPAVALA